MRILVRRLIKQLMLIAVIGFVVRKAMASEDPRVRRIGHRTNRLVGGVFASDETAPVPARHTVVRSVGTAVLGGVISYFFDPQLGSQRRARVKEFASERLARRGEQVALPSADYDTSAPAVERAVPRTASG